MNERIAVIGGTRGTGMLIAELLVHKGYRVRVLARDPIAAAARLTPAVEVIAGDITLPDSLPPAIEGSDHIIFTAGVRSGRIAGERRVKATDYQGVVNTLATARETGFRGRFMYLNSIGIRSPSWTATLLNLMKGNTLVWRRRVEEEVRNSGLDYTIIRVGFLLDRPGGRRSVSVGQGALPLAPRNRIARADVAEVFVAALCHPSASRSTFEAVWGSGPRRESWDALLDRIVPDT